MSPRIGRKGPWLPPGFLPLFPVLFVFLFWGVFILSLLFILVFFTFSVGPEVLQPVEIAVFGLEYVDYHIEVVQNYPETVLLALHTHNFPAAALDHSFFDVVGDGSYLSRGVRIADDEPVRYGRTYLFQVEGAYVFSLFLQHGLGNDVYFCHKLFYKFAVQIYDISYKNYAMNIHWMKITDSTNLDAWRGRDGNGDGTVWCAEYQSAGRGQRGNRWLSAQGDNLMFSILFKPLDLKAVDQFVFSQTCSVGVARYLKGKGLDGIRVKWPNDVYVRDSKICGMLLENTLRGDTLAVCIAGIGLNLNQRVFPPELPNPTSLILAMESQNPLGGHLMPFSLREELSVLLDEIFRLYRGIGEDGHVPGLDDEYESLLYRKGELSRFEETEYFTGGEVRRFTGRILGVERKTARLLVEHENGRVVKYYFKEIRYLL